MCGGVFVWVCGGGANLHQQSSSTCMSLHHEPGEQIVLLLEHGMMDGRLPHTQDP